MIKHQLTLDYTLAPGWMAPFVEGVMVGKAVARRCTACARVSFPPDRTCLCGEVTDVWVALSGIADIQLQTEGSDGRFAMVQFDGADTQSIVRLEGSSSHGRGWLAKPSGDIPMLIVIAGEEAR